MSPFAKAVTVGGVGTFLASTGLFFLAGGLFFGNAEAQHGGPIGKPGIHGVGMMFGLFVIPFLLVAMLGLIGFECAQVAKRLGAPARATWAGVGLSLALLVACILVRPLRLMMLPGILKLLTGDHFGTALGAAMQMAFGFWLLHTKRIHAVKEPET